MNLELYKENLPTKIDELSKFVLIKSAELQARRLAIKTIKNLDLAGKAHKRIIQETQELSEDVFIASVKLGELTSKLTTKQGARTELIDNAVDRSITKKQQLKKIGLTEKQAERFEDLAENQDLVFETLNEAKKRKDIATKSTVFKKIKKRKKDEQREKQSEEGKKIKITNEDFKIYLGDFKEKLDFIPNNSLDIIITDPPYPLEFIKCWSDLSLFASKKLKINGFCIAYSGQTNLIEVMNRMSENLEYYWTFALIHSDNKQLIDHRNLFCGWKPLIIFQNGLKKQSDSCEDIIDGTGIEKSSHDWQQSELELKPIIEHFTKPGETICDPFLGSGTTGIASYSLKRKFIGAEIEEEKFNIAKKRFDDRFKGK